MTLKHAVTEQALGVIASHSKLVRVTDVNNHHAHSSQERARILIPRTDYPTGKRQYTVEDFSGHRWIFSQTVQDVDPSGWGGTLSAEI